MSKFEQYGSITFSPTAITDKEEVHGLHKRLMNESGNTGIMIINVDVDDSVTPNIFTSDTSFEEINEAINDNRYVVLKLNYGGIAQQFLPLAFRGGETIQFMQFPIICRVDNQNNWTVENYPT